MGAVWGAGREAAIAAAIEGTAAIFEKDYYLNVVLEGSIVLGTVRDWTLNVC